MNFGADVARLLEIVAHALYSNRDVFLRELVSNASDACDRLRYEALQNPRLAGDDAFLVRVVADAKARTLTVTDNGIGMNRDDLVAHLGTIAKSGTKALMDSLAGSKPGEKPNLIGQFGVGFYACFMAADTVTVISRRAGETECWAWESDGRTGYTVRAATDAEAAQLDHERGTSVILHVKDDASEYLIDQKLTTVIQTWSDHVSLPVIVGADSETPVNKGGALWAKPKNDITPEQYTEFYRHIGHGMDDPLITSHWRAEGTIEYTALLYVPTMRPWDLYDPTRKNAVRLYVRRVFITDDCEGLIYPWLRFLRGVIDSEDLPLNVSREMLQHNPVIEKIRNGVAKRVLGDLDKLARDDAAAYATFWGQFGAVIKEGLYDAFALRDDLLKVTRFHTTHSSDLTSLADYAARMKDGQDIVYYASGENLDNLRNSPQLEGFVARGLEVLLFTDTIDDFWLQSVPDFAGKPFQSVTRGNVDLTKFDAPAGKTEPVSAPQGFEPLLTRIGAALGDEIGEVRVSARLKDSPVCLIAAENEVDLRMERVLRVHQQYKPVAKRILEINPVHPLIEALRERVMAGGDITDAAHLLLDQARIIQGEPVPDPSRFARAMSDFMARGLAA